MTHDIIYYNFVQHLHHYAKDVDTWFPNGKNSIRVRYINGCEFIFTYNKDSDWCYETLDCFIRRLKGDIKMQC